MQSLTTRDIIKPSVKLVRALQQAKTLEAELERFYKRVLDTTKLNHLYKSGEPLPKGASFSETVYFTKRIK